jgi:hypothetical protein
MNQPSAPRFYFALPRLLAKFRGGDAARAEKNGSEAWAASLAVYTISYLYFADFVPDTLSWWLHALIFVALAFLVWLFWLLMLHLNSLVLKVVRNLGFFRSLPIRRGQSVLVASVATAMAVVLVLRDSFGSEVGALWLIATALNLVAALILAFNNGDRA